MLHHKDPIPQGLGLFLSQRHPGYSKGTFDIGLKCPQINLYVRDVGFGAKSDCGGSWHRLYPEKRSQWLPVPGTGVAFTGKGQILVPTLLGTLGWLCPPPHHCTPRLRAFKILLITPGLGKRRMHCTGILKKLHPISFTGLGNASTHTHTNLEAGWLQRSSAERSESPI